MNLHTRDYHNWHKCNDENFNISNKLISLWNNYDHVQNVVMDSGYTWWGMTRTTPAGVAYEPVIFVSVLMLHTVLVL